jgi:hypothetical protein
MKLRLIIFLSILTLTTAAQTANPKRTVLFTMLPTEHIYAGEYFLAQSSSARKFSCILIDETKNNLTFVFNGTRVKTVPGSDPLDVLRIDYLNSTETNGYKFKYIIKDKNRNDQTYMNCFSENFGPFEDANFSLPWGYYAPEEMNQIKYYYKLGGRWYGKTSSKNVMLNAGDNNYTPSYQYKVGPYDYTWINGNYYITYNKSVIHKKAYKDIHYFYSNGENFAFCYPENNQYYFQINDTSYGPYRAIDNFETIDYKTFKFYYLGTDNIWYYFNGETSIKSRLTGKENFISEEFEQYGNPEVFSADYKNSLISDYKYEYVVIDGEAYGKSPAYHAWYDSAKNAFIWSGIEGKELVVYEFKL